MTRRGPKAIPTALLDAEGGKRKKANPREPQADPRLPPMPDWMHPYAQAEWAFIVPHLHRMNILKVVDKAVVAAYAVAYGRWRLAEEKVIQHTDPNDATAGLLIRTKGGNVIQNPLVGVANAARRDLVRAAAELGLTPSARAQIEADDEGDDDLARTKFGI